MTKRDTGNHAMTLVEMHRYLSTFEVKDKYRAERDTYLQVHLLRLQRILAKLPPGQPGDKLLELGASPYLMTLLLKRDTPFDVFTAIFHGDDRPSPFSVTKYNPVYDVKYTFSCHNFNVERDRFPYSDDFFDIVLCCELLEHLALDPTHMLVEIHRVLKPGGRVLITTPNVLVWRNVNALLRKRENIYHRFSGYGVYGRHNREWTLDEVTQLVDGCGYCIECAEQMDTYPHPCISAWLKRLFPHLRDMLFVLARAEGEPRSYYPDNLYMAMYAK